jgi:hypothetical protein
MTITTSTTFLRIPIMRPGERRLRQRQNDNEYVPHAHHSLTTLPTVRYHRDELICQHDVTTQRLLQGGHLLNGPNAPNYAQG